jgi:nucleoid-associated protein YgaU
VRNADPLAETVVLTDPEKALPSPDPVMQPTPPLSDLAAWDREAAEPSAALRRRRRGIAAGVLAGIVLVLLAVLALVPWLRGRAPESATAAATPTPAAPPASIATPTPAATPTPVAAPTPRPSPPLPGGEGGTAASTAASIQVRPGDTLWDLAAAHLGDPMRWPLLHEANRGIVKDPNLIYPGQSLRIPAG